MKPVRAFAASASHRRISQTVNHRGLTLARISTARPTLPPKKRGTASDSTFAVESSNSRSHNVEDSMFNAANSGSNRRPNAIQIGKQTSMILTLAIDGSEAPSDSTTPLGEYHKLIETGILRGDDHQTRIIQKLQDLHDKLIDYDPPKIPSPPQSNSLVSY